MNSLLSILLAAALPVPAPPTTGALAWHDCGDDLGAQCAVLTVPIDWDHPGRGTIELSVGRRLATDQAHKIGTLIWGPGGPWDPGVNRVTDAKNYERFSETVRSRFDIVGFDPRGSNGSHPVRCDPGTAGPQPAPVLTSQADFDATLTYNRKLWADCRTLTGPLWDHADMLSNIRDVDALRAALGQRQISFHGSSYGTLLGEQYAERYPSRVRAMVLESVDDHSVPTTAAFLTSQAAAFEDAFDDFADWCDRDRDECSLNARGGARTVWHRLIGTHNQFDLLAVSLKRLKDVDYPLLADYLSSVDDGGPALHITDLGVVTPAFCADWSLPVRDYAEYRALLDKSAEIAKDTGYPPQIFALTNCLGWRPVVNPQHVLDVHTRTPILLLNSRHDAATGLNWARNTERQLGRHGVLVTYDGAGHGAYTINGCMKKTADDYLVSLTVPPRGKICPIA